MPAHVFVPKNDPPSVWDRLKIHSTEVGLALLSALAAVQVIITPLLRAYAPSISLRAIDPELALTLAAFLGIGGVLAAVGVLWWGEKISTGWLLEETGWILCGAAWIGYGSLVAYAFPFSTLAYSIAFGMGFMCLFRAYVVICIDRGIRGRAQAVRTLREAKGDA